MFTCAHQRRCVINPLVIVRSFDAGREQTETSALCIAAGTREYSYIFYLPWPSQDRIYYVWKNMFKISVLIRLLGT